VRTAGRCKICGNPIEYETDRELRDINNGVIKICIDCTGLDLELPPAKVKKRVLSYRAYLGSEEWAEKKEAALKRADYACQLCKSVENLNVHHNTYQRTGHEKDSDLVVLCERCHHWFHEVVPGKNSGRIGLVEVTPKRNRKTRHQLRREVQHDRDLHPRD
jgi:hypothetical protein